MNDSRQEPATSELAPGQYESPSGLACRLGSHNGPLRAHLSSGSALSPAHGANGRRRPIPLNGFPRAQDESEGSSRQRRPRVALGFRITEEDMTRAIAYVRCSTSEQADSRLGLEAQRRALQDECARRGWELVETIEDAGYTARNVNRPGLRQALASLKRHGADVLVVSRLDRLSRSVQDFAAMLNTAQRQRWTVCVLDVSVDTSTPNGRLVANILISVAEWESAMIGARTSDAMAEAKRRGTRFGRSRAVSDEVVARIVETRRAGGSFAAIARTLDLDRVPTPAGGQRWYPSTVARIHRAAVA